MLALLRRCWPLVYARADHPALVVPDEARTAQPFVVLRYGYDLPNPIPNLVVGDAALTATLSFNRRPQTTSVPWDAVFAVADDEGVGFAWPESAPPGILVSVAPVPGGDAIPPQQLGAAPAQTQAEHPVPGDARAARRARVAAGKLKAV